MNQKTVKKWMCLLSVLCCLMLGNRTTGTALAEAEVPDTVTAEVAAKETTETAKETTDAEPVAAVDESFAETTEATNIASGTGWYLDRAGCLHLTGKIEEIGWKDYKSNIITVIAETGSSLGQDGRKVFMDCNNLVSADLSKLDTSNVLDMSDMFNGCYSLTTLDVSTWDTSHVAHFIRMFYDCTVLTTLDVSEWDMSGAIFIDDMFGECRALTTLDVSKWRTPHLYSATYTFFRCRKLTTLDVSNWDTSNVTDMSGIFDGCEAVKELDVSKWDTSNVTRMGKMFMCCYSVTELDVSKWNVSNVTSMQNMFNECSALSELDVSKWNVSNVTNMSNMFKRCSSLTAPAVSNWDMSSVTDMDYMFSYCSSLTTLDLSGWDISKVKRLDDFVWESNSLHTIIWPKQVKDDLRLKWLAEELLEYCPVWCDSKTGKMYSDEKVMQKLSGSVTLVVHGIDIRISNGWEGVILKWTPVAGSPVTVFRKEADIYRNSSDDLSGLDYTRYNGKWTKMATTTEGVYYDKEVTNAKGYDYIVLRNNATTPRSIPLNICRYVQPPTIESVTNVAGGVKVSWSSESYRPDGFFVYRKDTQNGTWHMIGSTQKNLTYTDTTVENGVVYYYAVKEFYKETKTYRSYSASSSAKNTVYAKNVFISAISNPRPGDFTVVHSVNDKATGYQIAYSTNSNMSGSKYVTQAGGNYTTIKATGLTKGKTYYVMVRPYKTVAGYTFYGAWSAKKVVTVTK